MAIPTQFSVTSTRTAPISNPALPDVPPSVIGSEDAQVIETNLIDSLANAGVGAPSIYTADDAAIIDVPVEASARAHNSPDAPDLLASLASADIDSPSTASSESAVTIPIPSDLTPEDAAGVDAPTEASAESKAGIDAPTSKTAKAKASVGTPVEKTALSKVGINAPVTKSAESKAAISAPTEKTPEDKAVIGSPSEKTALNKATIDTPTNKTAEDKASVDAPTAASVQPKTDIDVPSEATAQPISTADAPSVISANVGTKRLPPFPLNHARILYVNKLQQYNTITASNEVASNPVINALKPNTYETWRFTTSSSTMQVDFGGPTQSIDMLCIGSHNLHRAGATIEVWYEPEPGGTFVQFDVTKEPEYTESQPIVFYSETAVDALTIEVRITGATGVPTIGYISAGIALQMQRPFFNGHTPINDADVTEYYSNRSESGEIIGQMIRRQGYETTAEWQNIDDTWYRSFFAPFKQAAKLNPFFFCWNLLEYPEDTGFCRINKDVSAPMQNGTRTKRSISMTLLGAG